MTPIRQRIILSVCVNPPACEFIGDSSSTATASVTFDYNKFNKYVLI